MFYLQDKLLDIEEMSIVGRKNDACPYYLSKTNVQDAQVSKFFLLFFKYVF